jgi:hypothetical protein
MRVVLRNLLASDETDYRHSLTIGSEYVVIGLSNEHFRLVNDYGEPVLYQSECFEITDATEPEFWLVVLEDGGCYANPPGWGVPGFYEAWHDGVEVIRRVFSEQLAFWYPEMADVPNRKMQRTRPEPAR